MSAVPNKREAILAAAEIQFSQYGFRRTTMDDIARETGISRASLYSYFDNKEEIFRGVSKALFAQSLQTATGEMLESRGSVAIVERFYCGLCAFYARLYGVLESTPHGVEIMDASGRLNADIAQAYAAKIEALLVTELQHGVAAGEIDLQRAGCSAAVTAELIRLAAGGLKQGAVNFADYQAKLKQFLPMFFAGISAH